MISSLRIFFLSALFVVSLTGCSDSDNPANVFTGTSTEQPTGDDGDSGDEATGDEDSGSDDDAGGDAVEDEVSGDGDTSDDGDTAGDGDSGSDSDDSADDGAGEGDSTASITIVSSLGLINGADVAISTPDGTMLTGATGTLDDTSSVTIEHDGSYTGPIVVTITGNDSATYFDEAAGATLPMPSGVSIRAFAPSITEQVGVTMITELAAQIAETIGADISASDITAVNDAIRETFAPGLSDILAIPAVVDETNLTGQSLGNDDAGLYAMALAGLATLAAADTSPALAILEQLTADLTDGDIDGKSADGAITGLSYSASDFVSSYASALNTAAASLGNADLVEAAAIAISIENNLFEVAVEAGANLPASVTVHIDAEDIVDSGGGDITGNYDLTITGTITTLGVGTAFEAVIENIVAPSPGDTGEIENVILETVPGFSGITNLTVTIINNSTDRVTFDVAFDATQSGVSVSVELRYDYVPSGTTPDDSGASGDSGSDSGDSTGSGDAVAISDLGLVCFVGEPTAATIPSSLAAVYHLTYAQSSQGGPYADGELVHFTVSEDGTLDINGQVVLTTPVLCGGNEQEATWKDLDTGLIYSISSLVNGFNEINLGDASGSSIQFLGQFSE